MKQFDCIIIGGGISGLTAGFRLSQQGKEILILEKERVGGLIRSNPLGDSILECGATTIAGKPDLLRLISELELGSEIIYPNRSLRNVIWKNGAHYNVPKNPFELLFWNLLSLKSRLRILRALFSSRGMPTLHGGETLFDIVSRWLGEDVAEFVVAPLIAGIWGGTVHKLIAEDILPALLTELQNGSGLIRAVRKLRPPTSQRFFAIRGGNEVLCQALLKQLSGKLAFEEAKEISYVDSMWRVKTSAGEFQSKSVLICTASRSVAKLFTALNPSLSEAIYNLNAASLEVFHFELPKKVLKGSFGILAVPPGPNSAVGILVNDNIFDVPQHKNIATVTFGGIANPISKDLPPEVNAASEAFLGVAPKKILSHISWPDAIPQYDKNARVLREAVRKTQQRYPSLFFCSAWEGGVGVPDRVAAAEKISKLILAQL